jgi:CENP-B N-terminal DNA-binding domain.
MSKYTFEEKFEAVQRVLDGMSIHESARIMGVSFAQVQRWFHLYEKSRMGGIEKRRCIL